MKLPPPFPLAWPEGWQRTEPRFRTSSRYRVTMQVAASDLARELSAWWNVVWHQGASQRAFVITSNLQRTYPDGRPYASTRAVEPRGDPGVAVWWLRRGNTPSEEELRVVACDNWNTVAANLRACGVVIASLRAIERAEATEASKRAEWGFDALRLPPGGEASADSSSAQSAAPWWATRLRLEPPYTEQAIYHAWRRCVVAEHPDRGGSHEAFLELEGARDEALRFARAQRSAS